MRAGDCGTVEPLGVGTGGGGISDLAVEEANTLMVPLVAFGIAGADVGGIGVEAGPGAAANLAFITVLRAVWVSVSLDAS